MKKSQAILIILMFIFLVSFIFQIFVNLYLKNFDYLEGYSETQCLILNKTKEELYFTDGSMYILKFGVKYNTYEFKNINSVVKYSFTHSDIVNEYINKYQIRNIYKCYYAVSKIELVNFKEPNYDWIIYFIVTIILILVFILGYIIIEYRMIFRKYKKIN